MAKQQASLREQQREWVLNYMTVHSSSFPHSFDTGTTYDVGTDFCDAFSNRFPGRKPDPNLINASRRLARLLREMWEDGIVTRGRLGNEKYVRQEASWQYVYALFPDDWRRRQKAMDAKLIKDANAWYSDAQLKEIEAAERARP
jgi:hypothetical protein